MAARDRLGGGWDHQDVQQENTDWLGNGRRSPAVHSFFHPSQTRDSHGEAKMELFDFIEVFYNQKLRHSTLGQISPAEFERRSLAQAA